MRRGLDHSLCMMRGSLNRLLVLLGALFIVWNFSTSSASIKSSIEGRECDTQGNEVTNKIHVDSGVAIMVISGRNSSDVRDAIRETWGRGHTGIFFMIGEQSCPIPPAYRTSELSCENKDVKPLDHVLDSHNKNINAENTIVAAEADKYPDLVILPMVDTYRSLPHKVKLGYGWVLEHTDAKWVVKVDDDNVARIPNLVKLLSNYNSTELVVLGWVRRDAPVPKGGKWAEPHYHQPKYPPFANGAEGHAVSRGVAEAVVRYNGFEYQGEDVSLGIWLDEMKKPVKWVNVYPEHFSLTQTGDCSNTQSSIIGHDIKPAAMRECFGTNNTRF